MKRKSLVDTGGYGGQWKVSVPIKDILKSDYSLSDKAQRIKSEFDRKIGKSIEKGVYDLLILDLLDELKDAGEDNDVEWFDEVLEAIYDWADMSDVWLGI